MNNPQPENNKPKKSENPLDLLSGYNGDSKAKSSKGVPGVASTRVLKTEEPTGGQGATWENQRWAKETRSIWEQIRLSIEKDSLSTETNQSFIRSKVVKEMILQAKALGFGLSYFNGEHYLFLGTHWAPLNPNALVAEFKETCVHMGIIEDLVYGSSLANTILEIAQSLTLNDVTPPQDSEVSKVNLKNGTLHIDTSGNATLKDHSAGDFITYVLPYNYNQQAIAPRWKAFLSEMLPDEQSRVLLSEVFGAAFTSLKLEKAAFLYGGGANGKSVVCDVITELLGRDNVGQVSLEDLVKEERNRVTLGQKLINYCPEISGAKLKGDKFKTLASGEPIQARALYSQPFMLYKYAKLVFNGNVLPALAEVNEGFFRRLLIIEFDVTVPAHKRDVNLSKKICANELPGVLNWLLDGTKRLMKKKAYSSCEKSDAALEEYKIEGDSVKAWITERGLKPDGSNQRSLKSIYEDYSSYMTGDASYSVSKKTLCSRLQAYGYIKKRGKHGVSIGMSHPSS